MEQSLRRVTVGSELLKRAALTTRQTFLFRCCVEVHLLQVRQDPTHVQEPVHSPLDLSGGPSPSPLFGLVGLVIPKVVTLIKTPTFMTDGFFGVGRPRGSGPVQVCIRTWLQLPSDCVLLKSRRRLRPVLFFFFFSSLLKLLQSPTTKINCSDILNNDLYGTGKLWNKCCGWNRFTSGQTNLDFCFPHFNELLKIPAAYNKRTSD